MRIYQVENQSDDREKSLLQDTGVGVVREDVIEEANKANEKEDRRNFCLQMLIENINDLNKDFGDPTENISEDTETENDSSDSLIEMEVLAQRTQIHRHYPVTMFIEGRDSQVEKEDGGRRKQRSR